MADTETFTPETISPGDTCSFTIDGEVFWRGSAAELQAKGGILTQADLDHWTEENISHCTQCGWRGEGVHACPGLPGEGTF